MANEIWHTYEEGLTLYALIWRQADDKVYDAVAGSGTFDTYTDVDIDDYDIPLANAADSDYYSVDFPAGIAAGVYRVQIMRQVGGSIDADADVGVAQGEIYWDGTAEVNIYTLSETDVAAITAKLPTNYIMGSSDQDNHDTDIDAILVDTNEIQTKLPTNYIMGSSVQTAKDDEIDDIKAGIIPLATTVATSNTTTSFTLTAGVATADAYNDMAIMVKDADDSHWEERTITDWTAGRVVTVDTAFGFTPAVGDVVWIKGSAYGNWSDVTTILANTGKVVNVYSTTGEKKTIVTGSVVGIEEED